MDVNDVKHPLRYAYYILWMIACARDAISGGNISEAAEFIVKMHECVMCTPPEFRDAVNILTVPPILGFNAWCVATYQLTNADVAALHAGKVQGIWIPRLGALNPYAPPYVPPANNACSCLC